MFDAMIAAAALHADCETLWSEDIQDGITLEGRLRIVNPCRASVFRDKARVVGSLAHTAEIEGVVVYERE